MPTTAWAALDTPRFLSCRAQYPTRCTRAAPIGATRPAGERASCSGGAEHTLVGVRERRPGEGLMTTMGSGRLVSVNVGLPREITWRGQTVVTGIWKAAVDGPRTVRRLNVDGDGQ